ncbi:hypothetical protein [Shimia sp. Alg240-R146]|uniref:hypothetical protein n=1 Tax=Shimia sp. Alg240-R146 TaxID=2993449 RepID=UPI003FA6FB7B
MWSIGAVFSALFLQAPAAMPIRASINLFKFAILALLGSWLLFSMLAPYPFVFLCGVALAIMVAFAYSVLGAGVLQGIIALMAAMMVPNMVLQSGDLAMLLVVWIPANLLIAGLVTSLCFAIFPAAPPDPAQATPQTAPKAFDKRRRLLRMCLVTIPFALAFFVSGSSALLVLFFVAILAQQLAAMPAAGTTVAKAMLTANLLGAGFSIVLYEITVIAPSVMTPILLSVLTCLLLGTLMKSDHKLAPAAGSALTTAIIVYGGTIAPFSDEADVKSIVRVMQVGLAALIVITAYVVVDEFLPEQGTADSV